MNKVVIGQEELGRFIRDALMARGACAEDATVVADGLVWANLRGVDGHGVSRLPSYLKMIERGDIDVKAKPRLSQDRPATFVLDGGHGFGPVAMMQAATIAAERAQTAGVCFGLVRETTHTGAIGRYAQWMAQRGCIAMIMGAGPAFVAYHGARVASLGTSPIAIAVPNGGASIVLDMATSTISNGTIMQARAAGKELPPNAALTAQGEPTTDPAKAEILLPLGGPKGSGLGLMFEMLASVLAAAPIQARALGPRKTPDARPEYCDPRRQCRHFPAARRILRTMPILSRRSSRRCRVRRASMKSFCPASAPSAPRRRAANPVFRSRRSSGQSSK